ncbi:MAG: carboxypeptidase regulatory-like domain-containing protein [Sandaracinus sp.]
MPSPRSGLSRRALPALLVLAVCAVLPGGPSARPSIDEAASAAPRAEVPASEPVTARTLSLSGRLLGPEGEGLAGHVSAWREDAPDSPPVEVDCAADGTFTLADLDESRWVIAASAPGFSEARAVRALPLDGALELRVVRAARVAGRVLGEDGLPAAAEVLIVGSGIWPARSAHADLDGSFAFEQVPPGVYEVEARGALATSEPRRGLVVEEGARIVLTLALTPGRALAGTVVDDATGAPIAGAEIVVAESALSSTPRLARSDASGAFRITGLREGSDVLVTARAEGRVSLVAQPWRGNDLVLRLRQTGIVEGRVLGEDREPIEGASIEVWGETLDGQPIAVTEGAASFAEHLHAIGSSDPSRLEVMADVPPIPIDALGSSAAAPDDLPSAVHLASYRTGPGGRFRLEGVAPGEVEVVARHAGFATGTSARVRVTGGEVTEDVEVVLAPAGRLTGRVVDERGEGVADVRVEARSERDPWPVLAFTDARGEFVIAATGDAVVRAVPFDRAPAENRVHVDGGAEAETTLQLDPAGLVLEGRVLDPRGFPVEGAQLRIEALRPGTPILRTAFSAEDGTFSAASLPAPPLRITVDQNGYTLGQTVDVETLEALEIRLEAAVRAEGSVVDAWTGEPVPGARVLLVSTGLPPLARETTVHEDGVFAFPRLGPGTYALRIAAEGYVASEREIVVRATRSGEVELEPVSLDAGQRLEGDVVDHFGSVLEGAVVSIEGLPPSLTDAQGHFAITAVPAGDVVLHVAHPSAGELDLARHVTRGRDELAIVAHLPGRADAEARGPRAARARRVGIDVDAEGTVTAVARASGAERAGILPGDVLVSVDGRPGRDGLVGSGPALVTLSRGGAAYVVRVDRELR